MSAAGQLMDQKSSPGPYKGVAKEPDGRDTSRSPDSPSRDRVQLENPVTGHWVKVDTWTSRIIDEKRTDGPYKGVAIDDRQRHKN